MLHPIYLVHIKVCLADILNINLEETSTNVKHVHNDITKFEKPAGAEQDTRIFTQN